MSAKRIRFDVISQPSSWLTCVFRKITIATTIAASKYVFYVTVFIHTFIRQRRIYRNSCTTHMIFKSIERFFDFLNIFVVIGVIHLDVGDHGDVGRELEKGAVILIGLNDDDARACARVACRRCARLRLNCATHHR